MERPGRLATAVEARRKALMLSQEELASAAGLSLTTVRDVENDRRSNLRSANRRALTGALGWSPDSIDRILAGDEPALVDEPPPSQVMRPIGDPVVQAQLEALERRLAELEDLVHQHLGGPDAEHHHGPGYLEGVRARQGHEGAAPGVAPGEPAGPGRAPAAHTPRAG